MPSKPSSDKDIERGKRFAEICAEAFPGASKRDLARQFQLSSDGRIRQFEGGVTIDNRALAALLRRGADIGYILTGERWTFAPASGEPVAEPCTAGKLCERLPTLLKLLGEMFERAAANPEERESLIAAFQTAAEAISSKRSNTKSG